MIHDNECTLAPTLISACFPVRVRCLQRVSKTSLITLADLPNTSPTERQIYGLNKRIQTSARVPKEFPGFIVEGFSIKVVGDGYTMNEKGWVANSDLYFSF